MGKDNFKISYIHYTFPTIDTFKYYSKIIITTPKLLNNNEFHDFYVGLNFAVILSIYDNKLYGIKLDKGQPRDFIMCCKAHRKIQPLDTFKVELITIKNKENINPYEQIESELAKKKLNKQKYRPGKIILLVYLNIIARSFNFNYLKKLINNYYPFEFSQIIVIGGNLIKKYWIFFEIFPNNHRIIVDREKISVFLKKSNEKYNKLVNYLDKVKKVSKTHQRLAM